MSRNHLKSGIWTSENFMAPTSGISLSKGDRVMRILPLMISRCMQTCMHSMRVYHSQQCTQERASKGTQERALEM